MGSYLCISFLHVIHQQHVCLRQSAIMAVYFVRLFETEILGGVNLNSSSMKILTRYLTGWYEVFLTSTNLGRYSLKLRNLWSRPHTHKDGQRKAFNTLLLADTSSYEEGWEKYNRGISRWYFLVRDWYKVCENAKRTVVQSTCILRLV